jgi:hypothetical protein
MTLRFVGQELWTVGEKASWVLASKSLFILSLLSILRKTSKLLLWGSRTHKPIIKYPESGFLYHVKFLLFWDSTVSINANTCKIIKTNINLLYIYCALPTCVKCVENIIFHMCGTGPYFVKCSIQCIFITSCFIMYINAYTWKIITVICNIKSYFVIGKRRLQGQWEVICSHLVFLVSSRASYIIYKKQQPYPKCIHRKDIGSSYETAVTACHNNTCNLTWSKEWKGSSLLFR